jgi:hypothetical protein
MAMSIPAEAVSFGNPNAEFSTQGAPANYVGLPVVGLGMIVGGIALMAIEALPGISGLMTAMGVIVLVVGGYQLLSALFSPPQHVWIFDGGMIVQRGGSHEVIRWETMQAIYQNIHTYHLSVIPIVKQHAYTLHMKDGRKIALSRNIQNIELLGQTLHRKLTDQQFPAALDTLREGGTLTFGPIRVNGHGLQNGGDLVPWEEIRHVRLVNGQIQIKKAASTFLWKGVPASKIPNLYLFLTLINKVVATNKA